MTVGVKKRYKGFTIVEMIVVVTIISLLSAIIIASVSQSRTQTRDKVRVTDITQLELAFKLYKEVNNEYPGEVAGTYDDPGVEIGAGGTIDTAIASFAGTVPQDPNSDGSTYQYVYDTDFTCTNTDQIVLYVQNFEKLTDNANASTVCTHGSAETSGSEYVILLQ